jgi:predicted nucleic acid-binding protein
LNKVVVADTGPLIAFARLRRLDLLPQIFEHVFITHTVMAECTGRTNSPEDSFIREAIDKKHLELCLSPDFSVLARSIDAGEASAIAVAIAQKCGVLIDDKAGRKAAANLDIPVIGTVGVLVLAKRKALVPRVKPLLEQLVASGYFLGAEIVSAALASCDE